MSLTTPKPFVLKQTAVVDLLKRYPLNGPIVTYVNGIVVTP